MMNSDNFLSTSGQPYAKRETPVLISTEDVNKLTISPGQQSVISFCGSATYKLGVKGALDMYQNDDNFIASLHWNGPWTRVGNRFEIADIDDERYFVKVSHVHHKGLLGDVSITVSQVDT
jgi:hypothetical protein